MPSGSTRISAALTNLAVQYRNTEYIASSLLKDVLVTKESDSYWVWGNDFRIPDTERANGAKANMVTMGYSTSSYVVKEHALKDVITDRDRMNAAAPIQLDRDMTENLTDTILRRIEYEAAKLCFTTTSWGNNTTGTTATSWACNTTTAYPTMQVMSGTAKIIADASVSPNTMVIGRAPYDALREASNIINRIQYSERAIVTKDILAAMFDLQNIYVGTAVYDSTKEGETVSKGFIWGGHALLAYIDPSPGIRSRTAAVNFRVAQFGNPFSTKRWREEEIAGDYIEVQTMCAPRAVATSCAYLYKTVAALMS